MAFSNMSLVLFVLACTLLLHSHPVECNEKEEEIFNAINDYRKSLNISVLKRNKPADCLADEIADDLNDRECMGMESFAKDPSSTVTRLVNFPKLVKKCDIEENSTIDGVILPVCVHKLVKDVVLNNFTKTAYTKFLNNSRYTGAGVGSESDWIVMILSIDNSTGSFSGATSLVAFGMVQCFVVSFFGLFLATLSF